MALRLSWRSVFYFSLLILNLSAAKDLDQNSKKLENESQDNEYVHFNKREILIGVKKITVEIAETNKQHEVGLMFRKKLAKDQGMLFIFRDEKIRRLWMKNTIINLSMGYFDKNKKLIDIQEMQATSLIQKDFPTYPSLYPAMYALEMTEGWFEKNKIKIGTRFELLDLKK